MLTQLIWPVLLGFSCLQAISLQSIECLTIHHKEARSLSGDRVKIKEGNSTTSTVTSHQDDQKNGNQTSSISLSLASAGDFEPILLDSKTIEGLGGFLTYRGHELAMPESEDASLNRESRRIGPLRGMSLFNKPKVSPLYLINGTVCRFVNSNPICTTLSTQGLLPAASSTPRSAAVQSGVQGGGSSVVFASQNQAPPIRPAAILDDDSGALNLQDTLQTAESNSVRAQPPILGAQSSSSTGAARPQLYSPLGAMKPANLLGRRTFNLLNMKRPIRQLTQPQQQQQQQNHLTSQLTG